MPNMIFIFWFTKINRAKKLCRISGTKDDLPRKNPFNPVYHGWKLDDDGQYTIKWFDGELSPKKIDDISFSFPEEESPTSSSFKSAEACSSIPSNDNQLFLN